MYRFPSVSLFNMYTSHTWFYSNPRSQVFIGEPALRSSLERMRAERVGFEPTVRLLDVQPISSRPRYDHFGTSPCLKKLLEECLAFVGIDTAFHLHPVV